MTAYVDEFPACAGKFSACRRSRYPTNSRLRAQLQFTAARSTGLRTDLIDLDATLRLFDPETDPNDVPTLQHCIAIPSAQNGSPAASNPAHIRNFFVRLADFWAEFWIALFTAVLAVETAISLRILDHTD